MALVKSQILVSPVGGANLSAISESPAYSLRERALARAQARVRQGPGTLRPPALRPEPTRNPSTVPREVWRL